MLKKVCNENNNVTSIIGCLKLIQYKIRFYKILHMISKIYMQYIKVTLHCRHVDNFSKSIQK